jgi:D-alanine--poly(phosphoribitol) ligase subunit 1
MHPRNDYNIGLRFEAVADAFPTAPALICHDKTHDYASLNGLSNRFARWLLSKGVIPGRVVCIELPKSLECYVVALACIKIGAPYAFLDFAGPVDRAEKMLARCRPVLIVSQRQGEGQRLVLGTAEARQALVDEVMLLDDGPLPHTAAISGTDPAYVMFTSGSTGEPKGAVIPHQGVLNLANWAADFLGVGPGERLTNVNPIYFDNSVFDLYGSLLNGAAVVSLDFQGGNSPAALARKITEQDCTLFFAVPTMFLYLDTMRLLDPVRLPKVRLFMFGGEGFPIAKLRRFNQAFGGKVRLVNVYGPTETSCICSGVDIDETILASDEGLPPLGHLNANFTYRILDEEGAPVPPDGVGELWLGGPCVGLGYLNNPEETARRFRQDPLIEGYRAILYRSGDLVQECPKTGVLRFRGRADNQVKLRGYRIELEEIDHVLASFAGIDRALSVVVREANGLEKLVVAYAGAAEDRGELIRQCHSRLPGYMIPDHFVKLADIPLNANGKADRRAVAAMIADMEGTQRG